MATQEGGQAGLAQPLGGLQGPIAFQDLQRDVAVRRATVALAPGQWAASRALSFMVAVVLASRWSVRRREMACRFRVAASVGCRRPSRWLSVRRSSASLKLSPGLEVALDAPQRGRAALKLLGRVGTTGCPAASSRSTTIPLVASMATGRCSAYRPFVMKRGVVPC